MLEQILQHSEIGQYILDKSVVTSSLTQKIDPYYTRFQQDYISPAMNSPELKKKIAGYAGTIVADTLYFTAEAAGRGLEMAIRGSLWAGKKGMDYIRHSRYPSQLKLAAGISIAMLGIYFALPRFDSLPSSDTVEAILFSACRTVADSQEVSSQVYGPLKEKFPHLKLIVGFTGTSLVDDGVIPQVLTGKERLRRENGILDFANYAIGVNPDRVGVAILKSDDSWEFRDASQRTEISSQR